MKCNDTASSDVPWLMVNETNAISNYPSNNGLSFQFRVPSGASNAVLNARFRLRD